MSKFHPGLHKKNGWTAEEARTKVVELWRKGRSVEYIRNVVPRCPESIRLYLRSAGLVNTRGAKSWTAKEIETLIELRRMRMTYTLASKRLNRTRGSVIGKVFRLKADGLWPLSRKSR